MSAPLYRCRGKCGRELPRDAEHFGKHNKMKDGLHTHCRECVNAHERAKRANAAPKPRAGLTLRRRAFVTPWAAFCFGAMDKAKQAWLDTSDTLDDLSPLETTLADIRDHLSDGRRAPLPLGDED
jgi:hypothetical protein